MLELLESYWLCDTAGILKRDTIKKGGKNRVSVCVYVCVLRRGGPVWQDRCIGIDVLVGMERDIQNWWETNCM